ncbi:MAG: mechanosensitive ion channel [Roseibium album]|uniref:mechanosensitive ion channel family protein n=1 Tax=Roseibium album TaxID=311410 RepID=UPI0032EB277B
MELELQNAVSWLTLSWANITAYVLRPWTLYQLLIIVSAYFLALLLSRKIEPALEERARRIKQNPGLLRIVIALLRRTEWILFLVLLWIARTIIVESTWPSRGHIISIAMALAFVWLTVNVISRVIRNRTLARTIALGAFLYIAVGILGAKDDVRQALDSFAIHFGEIRISSLLVLSTLVYGGLLLWLANLVGKTAETKIAQLEDLSPSVRVLIGKILRIGLIVFAVVTAISAAGIDLTALTIFSGAIGLGLGFGLQKVVSNFVSGIIILSDNSIKPGDTIELGDTFGWIRELRARYVSVITRDGREYLIPNEDFITQQVVNWSYTDSLVRFDVNFGVSYDCDPHKVMQIAIEAASNVDRVIPSKKPVCWLTAFGESSLDFKLRFWIDDPKEGLTNIRGKVLIALWDAFKAEGIGIPYPHREIIMKSSELKDNKTSGRESKDQ